MKLRLLLVLTMSLLVLGALPAFAQSEDETFGALNCMGLSEADCSLVQESLENTHSIQSFSHHFSFSQSISNGSQLIQGFDSSSSAEGSGSFVIDREQFSDENPFAGFSMAADVSGTTTNSEGEQSGDTSVVIADGNLYLQDPDSGEWRGAALADLVNNPEVMSFPVMGMDMPVHQMMGMGMGMMGEGDTSAAMPDGFDPMTLLGVPGFLNQTRLPDETIDGQTMAVFSYTANIGTLLSNADFQAAFGEMSGMMGESEDAMAQQMAMMLPILLENTTGMVTLTRWIGTDDALPHRVVFDVDTAIDLGIKSGNGTPVPPIEVKLNAAVDLSNINETAAPTAPVGATIVPADELLPKAEMTPAS